MKSLSIIAACTLLWGASPEARAQDDLLLPTDSKLVNTENPSVLAKGTLTGTLEARALRGAEDLVYGGLALRLGLGRGLEGILRGAGAERKTFALPGGGGIRHGGTDVELALKYGMSEPAKSGVAGLIGISFAGTPAQSDPFMTLGFSAGIQASSTISLYANPRVVFIDDNIISGFGVGAQVRLSNQLSVIGDYTATSGSNTRSTATGALIQRDVYGVAIRYGGAEGRYHIDLGYSNSTGATTGFSLTPSLGGAGSLYAALSGRF